MPHEFAGVWPAMVTPLDESGRPAIELLDDLVDLYINQGLGGLYVLGSAGQALLLSPNERRAIAARVVKTVAGRLPVIVHVGANTTDEAVQLAKHAREIGADGIATIGPVFYPLQTDDIFEHYRRIGAAGSLPFFVYQIDAVNQPKLPPREYVSRVMDLPHIAGMKITGPDLYQFGLLHKYSEGKLKLFSGSDQLQCHAILSGAAGAIGFFYNLWGVECRAARAALLAGDVAAASQFMLTFQQVTHEVHAGGAWPFLRAAMRARFGIDIGRPRAPLAAPAKPVETNRVSQFLEMIEMAYRTLPPCG